MRIVSALRICSAAASSVSAARPIHGPIRLLAPLQKLGGRINLTKREQQQIFEFFAQPDAQGISNLEKVETRQKVIRRIATTDQNKSYEAIETKEQDRAYPPGVVVENEKLIGFGIHIFNEDVFLR